MKHICLGMLGLGAVMMTAPVCAATVVASVNGTPITDTDITIRTQLMSRMGKTATDNRRQALGAIIDDNLKIAYASNFNAVPDDKTVTAELNKMNLGDLSAAQRADAFNALKADIAWQVVAARTVLPTVSISDEDVAAERVALGREHGLPIEMEIVRLVDIPDAVAKKLTTPKTCDDAVKMAEALGGAPQRFTAMQYELSEDVRAAVAGLGTLKWSAPVNGSVLVVCRTKKTKEYGDMDKIIRQNATFKQAMFIADQQLKQLRRKAVIVINDDRYKL